MCANKMTVTKLNEGERNAEPDFFPRSSDNLLASADIPSEKSHAEVPNATRNL